MVKMEVASRVSYGIYLALVLMLLKYTEQFRQLVF